MNSFGNGGSHLHSSASIGHETIPDYVLAVARRIAQGKKEMLPILLETKVDEEEGFRDGLSEGQEISLQDGFNQGFADAADILFPFAELRGQISALLSSKFINDQDIEKEKESALQEFVDEVSSYEASVIKSVSQITEIVSSTDNTSIQKVDIDIDNPGGISMEDKSTSAPRNIDRFDGLPNEKEINFQRTHKLIINKASCAEHQEKLQYFKEKLKTILS